MPVSVDFDKLFSILSYDKWDPLLFSTSLFLFSFFLLLIVYRVFAKNKTSRVVILLLFSFYFYYKVTGLFFLVIIATSIVNYFTAIWMGNSKAPAARKLFFLLAVIANIGLLVYFKYTNFFIQIVNDVKLGTVEPMDIFLPIGISFYTFKALSYIIEVYWETIEPERNFLDFTLYIVFFANVLAGPIDRPNDFLPQVKKDYHITKAQLGMALFLIISGLIKKTVIADYLSLNFVDRVFDDPLRFTGIENLLAVYGYTLQIYCDFSGYTDMALGIALLLGYQLMENFNYPYRATSVAEFWRRWHISLSTWLLDYLFRPLQMKFRNWRIWGNALALLLTFIICGFWHGASWTFIFWGFLHGFFMVFSMLTQKSRDSIYEKLGIRHSKGLKIFRGFVTFNLVAFSWVFFRAANFENALGVFSQIFTFFKGQVFVQFVKAYPVIIALMITGYLFHYLPKSIGTKIQNFITNTPLIGKALIFAVVIWIVIQAKSADIQPFIYFKF